MPPKKQVVVLNAYMRRVLAQLRPRVQTRAGREGKDYRDGGYAQEVVTASADELKAGFERYLYPGGKNKSAGEKNYLSVPQQTLLLRCTLEAYYDSGYNEVLHQMSIPKAIDELVERRLVAQPWAVEYRGTGLYKGQVGSEEKAQARKLKALEDAGTGRRVEAIKTRENNLDGGAAAAGLHHKTSGSRHYRRDADQTAEDLGVEPPTALPRKPLVLRIGGHNGCVGDGGLAVRATGHEQFQRALDVPAVIHEISR